MMRRSTCLNLVVIVFVFFFVSMIIIGVISICRELWNMLQESSARTEAPSLRELSNQLHDGEPSARMHDGEPCASPQSEAPSLREPYNQLHDAELCARTEALSINPTLSPQQMNNNAQAQNRYEPQREEPEVTLIL